MKKIFLSLFAIAIISFGVSAQQRYGFVDTKYILSKIPDYANAQARLNKLSASWQLEIEKITVEIKEMHAKFRADEVFLSPKMREQREKAIHEKEVVVQKLQQRYFGQNGELYKKRQKLIKPIQDDIYGAIKKIARSGNYGAIFDMANEPTVIYCNPKLDLSDKVLNKLGINTK